jgi:diguanylate cyclase
MDGATLSIVLASGSTFVGCGIGWLLHSRIQGSTAAVAELQEKLTQSLTDVNQLHTNLESFEQATKQTDQELADTRRELQRLEADAKQAQTESGTLHAAMNQLQGLAASMAANVDEHNNKMQEINDELGDSGTQADAVVSAITQLVQANSRMQEQLDSAEEKLEKQQEELQQQISDARTDALTGLANRRAFDSEIMHLERALLETGKTSCVMMVDVDHFKKFNDNFGHQAGDEVLRGVGRVLLDQLSDDAIVCRYGGEEFCAIFRDTSIEKAAPLAEKARSAIAAARFPFEGEELQVTASAGLAELCETETANGLVKRADEGLYASKDAGRNCGHIHDGETTLKITGSFARTATAKSDSSNIIDLWTGLSDKATFRQDVGRRLSEWKRGGGEISLIILEIDAYNAICKELSETSAKIVVKATSQFLKATMREMDHLSRYDEGRFALLVPTATLDEATRIGERLRVAISSCKLPDESDIRNFTVSVSVDSAQDGDTVDSLLDRTLATLEELVSQGWQSLQPDH